MVVLYRDPVCIAACESEGEPPARIYGHRPLPLSRAGQGVQPRRLQFAERFKRGRGVKRIQKHQSAFVVEPSKPSAPVILKQSARLAVFE